MKVASPFRSVVPADFNALKQKEGFLVFLQMVETTSSGEAACMGTTPLKKRSERTKAKREETARKLEDAIFIFYVFFVCFAQLIHRVGLRIYTLANIPFNSLFKLEFYFK